jgi:putative colanic acid biosynthesis UDP-glucose lipid carrier transferase
MYDASTSIDVAVISAAQASPAPDPAPAPPAASKAKRAVDLLMSLSALVIMAPLLLLIALMIRLESQGPAIFRQKRGGLNGKPFVIYKFRTMYVQEDGASIRHAKRNDSRVTKLGAVLRRTSLDELPQLMNVLRGDMSIVGPRPHALAHDQYYGAILPDYHGRTACKPGLTGLAQVRGYRGDIADIKDMKLRVACDLAYIRSWSLALDIKLITNTLNRLPFDRSAY